MDTPICDFVREYRNRATLRFHMPGHKGRPLRGVESLDITEIAGADELYRARGIIRKSEENASLLFGTERTVYSTEGSSLCIRAMAQMALLWGKTAGRPPLILAGRNAHKSFLSACALLDVQVEWLYPEQEKGIAACEITEAGLTGALDALGTTPSAVYVTAPDYLGHLPDIRTLAAVCHRRGVPLLVDNAHGAYLKFLPEDRHPITLGADLCCDSAHKTLPVLTGGAYLHIGKNAPPLFAESAERAMALFASTSPSYLILQSLDGCNAYLASGYREKLSGCMERMDRLKARLTEHGYSLAGEEPMKLTLMPKAYGYTGDELHDWLREKHMECEFSDPDYLTVMVTPENGDEALNTLEVTLLDVPRKAPVAIVPPPLPRLERVLSIREAMLSRFREIPVDQAEGKVLSDAQVGCPPCVPVLMSGERIDQTAIRCFRYYGIDICRIVEDAQPVDAGWSQ